MRIDCKISGVNLNQWSEADNLGLCFGHRIGLILWPNILDLNICSSFCSQLWNFATRNPKPWRWILFTKLHKLFFCNWCAIHRSTFKEGTLCSRMQLLFCWCTLKGESIMQIQKKKKKAKHCKWVFQLDYNWPVISLAKLFNLLRNVSWNEISFKIVCFEVVRVSQFPKPQQKVYYFKNFSLQLSE